MARSGAWSWWSRIDWRRFVIAYVAAMVAKTLVDLALGKNPLQNGAQLLANQAPAVQDAAGLGIFLVTEAAYTLLYVGFFGLVAWHPAKKLVIGSTTLIYASTLAMPWRLPMTYRDLLESSLL